eukprot:9241937-Lingulodinium_polyedra.AAC.1
MHHLQRSRCGEIVQRLFIPLQPSQVAAWLEAGRVEARANLRQGLSHRAARRGAVRMSGPLPELSVVGCGRPVAGENWPAGVRAVGLDPSRCEGRKVVRSL